MGGDRSVWELFFQPSLGSLSESMGRYGCDRVVWM